MKFVNSVLKINKFHNNTIPIWIILWIIRKLVRGYNIKINADIDLKEKSAKYHSKDEKDQKPKKQKLPKIKKNFSYF